MNKKLSKKTVAKLIIDFLIPIILVFAAFRIFNSGIKTIDTDDGFVYDTFSNAEIVFGATRSYVGNYYRQVFGFSFMNLLPYILIVVSGVLFLLKEISLVFHKKWIAILAIALTIIAAVLVFFAPKLTVIQTSFSMDYITDNSHFRLAAGAIWLIILLLITAGLGIASFIIGILEEKNGDYTPEVEMREAKQSRIDELEAEEKERAEREAEEARLKAELAEAYRNNQVSSAIKDEDEPQDDIKVEEPKSE